MLINRGKKDKTKTKADTKNNAKMNSKVKTTTNTKNNAKTNSKVKTSTNTKLNAFITTRLKANANTSTKTNAKVTDADKEKKYTTISFYILAIFCIAVFSICLVSKSFQNDTFYTIKIGQLIRQNGIDYKDHFSWHENLPYMYPHWLYDVITSLIYDFLGGFTGLYIATMILSALLGLAIFWANNKVSKNKYLSFVMTLAQMYLLKDYIATRAQLVTFILFVLTIVYIEKFLEKPNWKNALVLIIIPILIANIHAAVFPFYFVLYLPYIGEYLIRVLLDWHLPHKIYKSFLDAEKRYTNKKLKDAKKEKAEFYQKKLIELNEKSKKEEERYNKFIVKQKDRRQNPYKIKLPRNDNVLKLILIMAICIFTGLLTPIKNMPYAYTYLIMKGNTTKSINEHLPLTLIENKDMLISMAITIGILIFTKIKVSLKDIFFLAGLTLLAFMSRRQVSMLVLFGGFVATKLLSDLIYMYDKKGTDEIIKYSTTTIGEVITLIIVFCLSYIAYVPNQKQSYISNSSYPVDACKWIKENLDYKNIKIFNDYNYGSYMLFNDIPVFIDSRCDLYTPEFNGKYDKKEKKYVGKDIFTDYINVSSIASYYDTKFEEYDITHVITKKSSKLKMLISRDKKYKEIYNDNNFVIYERNGNDK